MTFDVWSTGIGTRPIVSRTGVAAAGVPVEDLVGLGYNRRFEKSDGPVDSQIPILCIDATETELSSHAAMCIR
ncbi:MAG: hypothetical protein EA382_19285 [Spirochaetaceae bacterium]|nr:MAG: hypothetical protein EA382_19285 [Spirochaetaceae bacterium]